MEAHVDLFASMSPEDFQAFCAKVQQQRLARQVPRQADPTSAPDSSQERAESSCAEDSTPAEVSSEGHPADLSSLSEGHSDGSGSLLTSASDDQPDGLGSSESEVSESEPDDSEWDPNIDSDQEPSGNSEFDQPSAMSDGDGGQSIMISSTSGEDPWSFSDEEMSATSSGEFDDAGMIALPPPELLTYHSEPLSTAMEDQLKQDLNQYVDYHGRRLLKSTINLEMFGSNGLTQCIEQHGSWIVTSPEQSGKTGGEAALALTSMRMAHPSVLVVKDVKGNAKKVSDDLSALLSPIDFGMTVHYASGEKDWDVIRNPTISSKFKLGKVLLVISAHSDEIKRLNYFLQEHQVTGLTVIADESDNIWSTEVIPGVAFRTNCCLREQQMYQLLSSVTDPARRLDPLAPGSRVRSLIQVSATHIATIVWHCQWQLPFRYVSADKSRLIERGYALEHDLDLVARLDPDEIKANNGYGMQSPKVVKELGIFSQDSRHGRLMMICLSPYVNKPDAMTSFAIAQEILANHVKDAVCIVMHGGGVNALYNDTSASSSSAEDYSCGKGKIIFNSKGKEARRYFSPVLAAGSQATKAQRRRARQKIRSKQAGDAIRMFDRKFGLVRPHIVIGYSVIGRCASIRSSRRVITHVIGAYQRGRSKADAEQMLLRSNGKSRRIRAKNQFENVRMVTTEESFQIVQHLYDFTEKALEMSGTGRQEDLRNWYQGDYPERYKSLFHDKHPWVRKGMGTLDVRGMRISGQPVSTGDVPLPKGPKRKTRGSVRRRKRVDPESTIFRLMRCIWAVAADAPETQFKRADLDAYIDQHPNIMTKQEYVANQHSHAWSIITSRCHYAKKIDKATGLCCLTKEGREWCAKHLCTTQPSAP